MRKSKNLIKDQGALRGGRLTPLILLAIGLLPPLSVLASSAGGKDISSFLSRWSTSARPQNPLAHMDPDDAEEMLSNLEYGFATAQQCLDHYGDRIAKSAEASRALGERYSAEGQHDEAIKWLEKAVALQRDKDTLTALANAHLANDDEEKWVATLKQCFDLPYRYSNVRSARLALAKYYTQKGEWETALIHAEALAGRGNRDAQSQTAWLYGALGNPQTGQAWLEQQAFVYSEGNRLGSFILTYGTKPTDWTWMILDHKYENAKPGNQKDFNMRFHIAILREDYEDAVSIFEQTLQIYNDPWYGVMMALISEDQGWLERRDKAIADTLACYPKYYHSSPNIRKGRALMIRFLGLYQEVNRQGALSAEMKGKIMAIVDELDRNPALEFAPRHIGEFFRLKGDTETAIAIHKKCLSAEPNTSTSIFLAYRGLRLMGEDPIKILKAKQEELKAAARKNEEGE